MNDTEIENIVAGTLDAAVTDAERAVLELIMDEGPITQHRIAMSENWLGCHPEHEEIPGTETTLRQVRQIVRDLRMKRGIPILADREGYYLPCTVEEVTTVLERMEREARARAKSSFETWQKLARIFGEAAQSDFFDKLEGLVSEPSEDFNPIAHHKLMFVYGTLRSGFSNNRYMNDSRKVGLAKTVDRFTLTSSGIPFVSHEPLHRVVGEVYEVPNSSVPYIDQLEGHPRWYKREEVLVEITEGEKAGQKCKAWLYFNDSSASGCPVIESGDFASEYE